MCPIAAFSKYKWKNKFSCRLDSKPRGDPIFGGCLKYVLEKDLGKRLKLPAPLQVISTQPCPRHRTATLQGGTRARYSTLDAIITLVIEVYINTG